VAESTEIMIEEARNKFKPVSIKASILYFVLNDGSPPRLPLVSLLAATNVRNQSLGKFNTWKRKRPKHCTNQPNMNY